MGCAGSSHPGSSRPTTESVRVVGDVAGGTIRMAASDNVSTETLAFAADKVWGELAPVYDSLGIPIGTVDSKRMLIGNTGFSVRQRLGKVSLSKYIDCGRTQGFPSADSYDVHLQITTQVRPKDSGSLVSTLVESAARPAAISGDYVRCSSLGVLESSILAGLRAHLKS
jgi:hypothetical protein